MGEASFPPPPEGGGFHAAQFMKIVEARDQSSDDHDPVVYAHGFFQRNPKLQPLLSVPVKNGPRYGTEIASVRYETIILTDAFWDFVKNHPADADFIFAHELGHYVSDKITMREWYKKAAELGVDPWDTDNLPLSQFNAEEAFAETFAVIMMGDSIGLGHLQRHSGWIALIRWACEQVGIH